MRVSERQARLKKVRKARERQVLLVLIGLVITTTCLWSAWKPNPKYPDLKVPKDFYKPQLVSVLNKQSQQDKQKLSALPLKQEDNHLRAKIDALIATYPDTLKTHLFYLDIKTGSYVDLNGETPTPAASVIKLPVFYQYLLSVEKGDLTPYQHLIYQDFEQAGGSGGLQYKSEGLPLLAKDVAQQMIQASDNTCTNMLLYELGGSQGLNQTFQQWGLTGTHINNWLPDLSGTNVVSMKDNATILYNLYIGTGLSPETKETAFSVLQGTHNRRLIPALLPAEVKIAHKTGDIGTALGNAALLTLPNGKSYILSIQVERPYNNFGAKELIQKLSKVIYDDVVATTPKA